MCVCVLLVFRVCEVRRRYQVPSNQSSSEVWATMWGLATEEQQGLSTAKLFLQLPARAIWRLWREIIQISKVSGLCRRRHLGTWLEQVLVSIFEKNPVELVPGIASYEKKLLQFLRNSESWQWITMGIQEEEICCLAVQCPWVGH